MRGDSAPQNPANHNLPFVRIIIKVRNKHLERTLFYSWTGDGFKYEVHKRQNITIALFRTVYRIALFCAGVNNTKVQLLGICCQLQEEVLD